MIRLCDPDLLRRLDYSHPATWLATWGGLGLIKPAPGTWGSLGALPIGFVILYFGGTLSLLLAIVVTFLIGLWSAKHFERMVREKDSSAIVIDEVVGQWIALIPATLSPLSFLIAFLLFRLFDIWKPFPIRTIDERIQGAFGVMIDDVIAGIFAALLILGGRYAHLM